MPVPGSSGDEDQVARGNNLFLGLGGHDPLALDDVQHLVLLVNMRPGPCARAEGDVQEVKFVIFLRHSRVALSFSRERSMAG